MKLFLFMLLSITIIMFFINHPLSMGLLILLQTFLISILSGMFIKTYWFSYILFLTFLGGLLVLFIYVSSIASNEMFSLKKKNFFFFFIYMLIYIIFNNYYYYFNNLEMNNFFSFLFFNNENVINLSKLYNNQTYMLMLMMMIYLFITLIAVIKVTNIFYGPLRPFNS
uniref:NADH dehydrogenase subunit 6 n=1 Tax=Endotricha kuznetzovi TaxID=2107612 RepID=UPI001FA6E86A|nr:NADH dehydrogenase subunit 6 [Endotricha kuznetzovi]UMR54971.1 NADH dehydrogenase subunit 6 [Endotricha kuznetzovi]